jgi:translation initiation factor 1
MSTILNLNKQYPFKDNFEDETNADTIQPKYDIHIRNKQRNGKKSITTVEGLNSIPEKDLKKYVSFITKKYGVGGTVLKDEKTGDFILSFNGDIRNKVKTFLIEKLNCEESEIFIHGF